MDQADRIEEARSTWPVVMQALQFWNESTTFHAPESRFTSRFVAVGYYLDPQATASTPDPTSVPGAATAAATATVAATGTGGGSSGVQPGVVAGATVGGVVVGCLAGAGVCALFMARRRKPASAEEEENEEGEGRAVLKQEAPWRQNDGLEMDATPRVEMPAGSHSWK